MYNWSVDTRTLKKHKDAYAKWRLEQQINYGLGRDKLRKALLRHHWKNLFMDEPTRRYLTFLLWPKKRRTSSPKSRRNS